MQRWLQLAADRNVWGIVIGRALTDPIGWFYVFWLPQYLSDARGFSLQRIAMFAWMPFVASDIGNFTGGWISGYCIRRGMSVVRARLWVCVFSCVPMLAGIPAASVHSSYAALALICLALWGFASWSTMGLTFPSDLLPQDVVATVTGLSGLAAGLVGAAFTFGVGMIVDRFSSPSRIPGRRHHAGLRHRLCSAPDPEAAPGASPGIVDRRAVRLLPASSRDWRPF